MTSNWSEAAADTAIRHPASAGLGLHATASSHRHHRAVRYQRTSTATCDDIITLFYFMQALFMTFIGAGTIHFNHRWTEMDTDSIAVMKPQAHNSPPLRLVRARFPRWLRALLRSQAGGQLPQQRQKPMLTVLHGKVSCRYAPNRTFHLKILSKINR